MKPVPLMVSALVLSMVSAGAALAQAPAPAPVPAPAATPAPPAAGRGYAVVSTAMMVDECSGMGGEHYVFDVDGDTRRIHAGGHGEYLRLLPSRPFSLTTGGAVAGPTRVWFVAEVLMVPRVSEDADGNPDSSRAGWCLDRLPTFHGEVLRLISAVDRDDAVRILGKLGPLGLPRMAVTLPAAGAAAKTRAAFALARVSRQTAITDGVRYDLEAIEGDVPASVDVPAASAAGRSWLRNDDQLWTGDAVVVATTGSGAKLTAIRLLAADDLAGARRWLAQVRTNPWPPSWQVPGAMGAFTSARWAAVGKVVKGKRGCGLELAFDTHRGSSFSLEPMRVAAPAGVLRGSVVTAVVVPNTPAGPDRCGRTAHVLRAYLTPGGTQADWLVGGEPAPVAPWME